MVFPGRTQGHSSGSGHRPSGSPRRGWGSAPVGFLRPAAVTTAVCAMLALSGCAPGGVTIPPGYEELPPCPERVIAATELRDLGEPACDLTGSRVSFPGGTVLTIDAVGTVLTHSASAEAPQQAAQQDRAAADPSEVTLTVVNWGIPGVGASLRVRDRVHEYWASSDTAAQLQRSQEALG